VGPRALLRAVNLAPRRCAIKTQTQRQGLPRTAESSCSARTRIAACACHGYGAAAISPPLVLVDQARLRLWTRNPGLQFIRLPSAPVPLLLATCVCTDYAMRIRIRIEPTTRITRRTCACICACSMGGVLSCCMHVVAGLGLFSQKSAWALAQTGLLFFPLYIYFQKHNSIAKCTSTRAVLTHAWS
jgi:hypothetical protein